MSVTILTASSLRRCVRAWTSGSTGMVRVRGRMGARAPSGRAIRCRALPPALPPAGPIPHGQEAASGRGGDCSLVKRHGRGIKRAGHQTRDPREPDGKYLIKGGGPKVWKRFLLRKEHRRLQGIIHGKRCGTTQNIGPAARVRWLPPAVRARRSLRCPDRDSDYASKVD